MPDPNDIEVDDLVAVVATGDVGKVGRIFERHRKWGGGTRYRINVNRGPNCGRVITLKRHEFKKL